MASLNSFGPSSPPQPRFSKVNDYTLDKGFKEWDLLDSSTDHAIIKHHKLYKFVETKAPDDYVISNVSGATYSSEGILDAAQKALAQAKN